MKPSKLLLLVVALIFSAHSFGQKDFNDYKYYYPIGEDPNMRYMTSYRDEETILFEANPTVRYNFYNNIYRGLINDMKHTQAYYVAYRPQLRMYTENSLPVKMPSQRVFLGTQHLFRLDHSIEKKTARFLAVSLESGHYSNGQSRSAFSDDFADKSEESDSLYNLVTPETELSDVINRTSGNFSTNMTELIVQHKWLRLDDNDAPRQWHSAQAGIVNYHDKFLYVLPFGGFSHPDDIKIYGNIRYLFGYEYMIVPEKGLFKGMRWTFAGSTELIQHAHESVNPFRGEATIAFYPFIKTKEFGFFISGIYGHDNYNLRLVDSGGQFTFGIRWCQWVPFAVVNQDLRQQ